VSSWRRCKHLWELGPHWGKSAILENDEERKKMAVIIPRRRGGTWEGVPVATWCSEWICRMRGGLVHHTIMFPAALSPPLLRGAYSRSCTDNIQNDWFCTRLSNFFPSPIFSIASAGVVYFVCSLRKVCPYKNQKNSKKTENHAGVRYVSKLSVPEFNVELCQCRRGFFPGTRRWSRHWK